jgi:hypothetical protein
LNVYLRNKVYLYKEKIKKEKVIGPTQIGYRKSFKIEIGCNKVHKITRPCKKSFSS